MSDQRKEQKFTRVPGIASGQPITGRWLTQVADNQNALIDAYKGPASLRPLSNEGQDFDVTYNPSTQLQPIAQAGSSIWTETSRATSTVRINDPSSSAYVDVERIEAITFASSIGTMTLRFQNS